MDDLTKRLYTYSRLEEVASFLLYEAFRHAHFAAEYEVAGLIFGERIMAIEPEPGWIPPSMPEGLSAWLRDRDKEEGVDDATIAKLSEAWHSALADAASSGKRLPKTHRFSSTDVIGHVINLSACVESVVNRHLFQLREVGELDTHYYISLDKAEVLPKVLFAFKEEIMSGRLTTSRLRHLISLRNNAVHFKASSVDEVAPTAEELLGIWREVGQLFGLIDGEPTLEQINQRANEFESKWL